MDKKTKITYVNNERINRMIDKREKFKKLSFTFGGLAVFSEIGATITSPNPVLSAIALVGVLGIGICANKAINLDKKIEHYISSHQKKLEK